MSPEFFYRNKAGFILVVMLSISVVFLTLRIDRYVAGIKTSVWFMVSPEIVSSGKFFNKLDNLGGRLFKLVRAEGENQLLRKQNALMAKRELEREALEEENNRLRDLLGLQKKAFADSISAEVLGHDPRDWFHSFIINKGRAHGIILSAAVVSGTEERPMLVGRIVDVSENTSKVLLITDVESALSAEVKTKTDLGLLEGKNLPKIGMSYLSQQSKIAVNDEIISAGLGGVFPPGIIVGTVDSVRNSDNGFFKEASVSPAVDFGSLREVMVLARLEKVPVREKL